VRNTHADPPEAYEVRVGALDARNPTVLHHSRPCICI